MNVDVMGLIVKREDGSEQVNYDDPNFPSYIYDGWIKPNVTWEKVPHFHEDVEFVSVRSGKMAYCVNGKVITLNAGDTIFVNANQIHYSISEPGTLATYVIFVANPAILNASVSVQMQALLPVLDNPNLPYIRFRYINENSQELQHLLFMLPDLRRDPFQITRIFFEIWNIILTQSKSHGMLEEDAQGDLHAKAFKAMMFYIQKEYQNPLTLQEIAESGNVSRSLCNKIFHKYVGNSPVNYLLDFRVRKVAEYLRTTTLPLSEISTLTGFGGASYMSEMFKKAFGKSPREYRKMQITSDV